MRIYIAFLFAALISVQNSFGSTNETVKQAERFPLTIDSRDGMHCDREKQFCTAEGQVVVKKGEYEMYAKKAKAFMRRNNEGKNEINRIEAYDDIRFFGINGETSTSDSAIYDLDQQKLELTPSKGKQVILWKDDYILKASHLEIYFRQDESEKYSLDHIDATGQVALSSPEELVEGDKAVFTPNDNMIIVTGDVRVTKEEGQLRGKYAKVNVDTKFSEVLKRSDINEDSRVRVFVYPEKTDYNSVGSKVKSE